VLYYRPEDDKVERKKEMTREFEFDSKGIFLRSLLILHGNKLECLSLFTTFSLAQAKNLP
jgi:hypothetical protein